MPLTQVHGPVVAPPPFLSPSTLFESQAALDRLRLQAYNRILASIHKRIKFIASQASRGSSAQMTHYDFPEWVPGYPRFDVKDCILYVTCILRQEGFTVVYMSPNRLFITWKDHAVQYYQEESPIRLAVNASAQQAQGHKNEVAVGGAAKKRAGAYRPASEEVAAQIAAGARKTTTSITFI